MKAIRYLLTDGSWVLEEVQEGHPLDPAGDRAARDLAEYLGYRLQGHQGGTHVITDAGGIARVIMTRRIVQAEILLGTMAEDAKIRAETQPPTPWTYH